MSSERNEDEEAKFKMFTLCLKEAEARAEQGMKLFTADDAVEGDQPAATAFKEETDAKIAELDKEVAALTGKDNKKIRQEKDKEKTALKNDKKYIDACKVVKGNPPANGFFVKAGQEKKPEASAAPAVAAPEEKKDDKKASKKKTESAGISRDERAELESLKTKIIEKKGALKTEGLSGGQINKHEDIVKWVSRMNELKEKETPGSTTGGKNPDDKGGKKKGKKLDTESMAVLEAKQKALEEYLERLRTEFKYSKKEIAADPEYQEMKAEVDKLSK